MDQGNDPNYSQAVRRGGLFNKRRGDRLDSCTVTRDRKLDHRSSGSPRVIDSLENLCEAPCVIHSGAFSDVRPNRQPLGRKEVPTVKRFEELDSPEPSAEILATHDTSLC